MGKYLLLFVLLIGLSACLDAEKKERIAELDRMTFQLDSIKEAFVILPLDSINLIREHVNNNEKYIKTYYFDDTLDVEFARAMNRYRGIRKGAGHVVGKKVFLDTIIDFQLGQLEKLKTDISNNSGKREKYEQYVNGERENVSLIISSYRDFEMRFSLMRSEFNEVNPIIEEVIARLKRGEEL
jgi:hypothetical protein